MVIWMPSRYDARYKIDVTKGCLQRISDGKEVWGIRGKKGYHRLHFAGKTRCFHHIIWAEAHGRWPKKNLHVAHMDDVPYHNWVTNLREMTPSENNKMAAKHRDYTKILLACRKAIAVVAKNLETGAEQQFKSLYAASKELDINAGLISVLLRGVGRAARSKKNKVKYTFTHVKGPGRTPEQTRPRSVNPPPRQDSETGNSARVV